MKIKRLVILCMLFFVAFLTLQSLFSESLYENEWYMKSKEYLQKAQEAFDQGDYDKGNEYAQMAEEYAKKAENEANKIYIKQKADASRRKAEANLNKAKDLGADTNPETKELYEMAKNEYDSGSTELDKASEGGIGIEESQPLLTQAIEYFESSSKHSQSAITAIQDIAAVEKLMKDTKQGLQTLLDKGYITKGDSDEEYISGLINSGEESYQNKEYSDAKDYLSQAKAEIADLMQRGDARAMYERAENALAQADDRGVDESHPDEYNTAMNLLDEAKIDLENSQYQASMNKSQQVIDTLMVFGIGSADVLPKYYKVRLLSPRRDCFSKIAGYDFVYGDEYKWRVLYEANKDKIPQPDNPHLILVDMIMEIPSLKGETREGTYSPDEEYTPFKEIKGNKGE
jgi:nucleoid-associated protein YgaU